jgi:hypothetical protein
MSERVPQEIDRNGLGAPFVADETLKSNLIVEGQLLSAQDQPDAAADRVAQAAEIEERLSARRAAQGLAEETWVHRFSAASCWARAADFHTAIGLGEELLSQADLPPRLRQRVEEFTLALRQWRRQWGTGLVPTAGAE